MKSRHEIYNRTCLQKTYLKYISIRQITCPGIQEEMDFS